MIPLEDFTDEDEDEDEDEDDDKDDEDGWRFACGDVFDFIRFWIRPRKYFI